MRPSSRSRLRAAFDEMTISPGPGFTDRVWSSLRSGTSGAEPGRGGWVRGLVAAGLAAAVLLVLLGGLRAVGGRPATAPASVPATPKAALPIISGTVVRVAGSGVRNVSLSNPFLGNGGPALQASFGEISALAVDPAGNLIIADNAVAAGGTAQDGSGEVREVDIRTQTIGAVGAPVKGAYITGLATDAQGDIFFAVASRREILELVAATGEVRTIAGGGPPGFAGPLPRTTAAGAAGFYGLSAIVVDPVGDIVVADTYNNAVRMVMPSSGTVTLVAGTGRPGYTGDGGMAVEASLDQPTGVAVDRAGDVLIADSNNHVVRMVSRDGRIRTIAGTGRPGYSGDGGPAPRAALGTPWTVAEDGSGNLYIADRGDHVVRVVSRSGLIYTAAGSGREPHTSADFDKQLGMVASHDAQFTGPDALATGKQGQVYIADDGLVRELQASA